ncbi:50S ribosomal protein L15 [Candidatus Adlerbacteria bacterium RIFCSPLOWO2_01_FULL_51_16]|uniref:Large ribosomal subunit protein uL15 n=1 Tax=Candidatus Adlerbacteria bacterium RIFCSPLOWO2_01_FULL_51_16 TaxID=1797243 RepID=A0A1F4XHA8_9BACT|nr:MAG: 50S ribosomal protein L15 [Candidatus Adlerbacteria bacterium RIFCSPLOWO2_01_FULL_51_16]
MQLNELKRAVPQKTEKRVGRGGSRGKTAGRGTKGQKARAGHRIFPQVREQLKKLPKLRGYRQKSIQEKPLPVNLDALEIFFATGDTVNPKVLLERRVVRYRKGETPRVKILGTGALTKKLNITGCTVSTSAREKIEKIGGTITP